MDLLLTVIENYDQNETSKDEMIELNIPQEEEDIKEEDIENICFTLFLFFSGILISEI